MYIIINNNKIPLVESKTLFSNFKGLMFKKNINYCLKLKCNGIHTFFMKENIDVILTDKQNNVLYIHKNLKKNRILLPKSKVYYTYELPKNTIIDLNIKTLKIKSE